MAEPDSSAKSASLPVGVLVTRAPGVTRWAPVVWRVTGLLPGAGPGGWREVARDGEAVTFHAATARLTLWRAETEAYRVALAGVPPSVWAIMRREGPEGRPELLTVTASAYEAQDYADNGDDVVERVPMPEGLRAWIGDFVDRHHREEEFVKRKRRPHRDEGDALGRGDARVTADDVYRAPGRRRP